MIRFAKPQNLIICATLACIPISAFATNGMNLEGYGAQALGMGGASMAYDNGTAAVMNNPATLGMMESNNRLDVSLGFLGPNITSSVDGFPDAESSADGFYMPAVGYVHRTGIFTYGFGLFSQGGMGTEYSGDSFMAAGTGKTVRSEVGVGRLVLPLNFAVNKKLNLAFSADFVWGGMDLQMAMSGTDFFDMTPAGSQSAGTVSGSMLDTLFTFLGPNPGQISGVNNARYDFSNSNAFTGQAKSTGYAGKVGLTYEFSSSWSLGATYHSKTSLDDMETSDATLSMNVNINGVPDPVTVGVAGNIKVKDFQWPATLAVGGAWTPGKKTMIAFDLKQIQWSDVMEDFSMDFVANATQDGQLASALANTELDATLFQKWKDQTVFQVGGAYEVSNAWVVRGGYNYAQNPVPDEYINALFPATVEHHITGGFGWDINQKGSTLDFALSFGLDNTVTNTQSEVTTSHSQISWQLMYANRF